MGGGGRESGRREGREVNDVDNTTGFGVLEEEEVRRGRERKNKINEIKK